MKKSVLLLFPLLISTCSLISCSKEEARDYNIVKFNYNHELNKNDYITSVIKHDEPLLKPKDPNVEDYVFAGWYLDQECSKECLRFGLAIDSDFTLYAKWTSYSELKDVAKIDKFKEAISNYSNNTYHVIQEVTATIGYPGVVSGEDGVFYVHDKRDYNRYKDITTVDYYSIDNDNKESLYGTRQYYYDQNNFYDIYLDLEKNTDNEYNSYEFDSKKINTFLSIDYSNLFCKIEQNLKSYIESNKYNEETLQYEFDFNYTKLNDSLEKYVYQEGYAVATYSDSVGAYTVDNYVAKYGLIFENGKIKSANINIQYVMYLGEDIMQYVIENSIVDFYYNNGAYSTFDGNKYPFKA